MSYLPMGQAGTTATTAALRIAEDPFLQEAACEVLRLNRATETGRPGAPCPRTPRAQRASRKGVGLRYAVGPLRVFILHTQHPWVVPVAAASLLGLVFYLGYDTGKGRR